MTKLQLNRRQRPVSVTALALLFAILAGLHTLSAPSNAAEIVFDTYDYIYGKAQLGSNPRNGSWKLSMGPRYATNPLARVYSSTSVNFPEAYSKLEFQPIGATALFNCTTFANPAEFNSGYAQIYTTYSSPNNNPAYVRFYVRPTGGESANKPITVTFKFFAQGTIVGAVGKANTGYEVYTQNTKLLSGYDNQSRTNSKTISYPGKFGQWFNFAMVGVAQGTKTASASLTLKMDITAR